MDKTRFQQPEYSNTRRVPALSPRLKKIADLVQEEAAIWDVGTDHGKLPVRLLLDGKVRYAIASDIKEGPLNSAKETAMNFGVEDRIEYRLCDGLGEEAPDGIDTVVIAGMGGETIINILKNAQWIIDKKVHLLMQPMSGIYKLRSFLYSNCYKIFSEHLVREKEKIYLCIDASGGGKSESFSFVDTRIGKYLVEGEPYRDYLVREKLRLKKEFNGADDGYRHIIQRAISDIESLIAGCLKRVDSLDKNNGGV